MRNYLKMHGIYLHGRQGSVTADFCAWGGTPDKADLAIRPAMNELKDTYPNMVFTPHRAICYFLLNEDNFALILNGPLHLDAGNYGTVVWMNVMLPFSELNLPPQIFGNLFAEITQLEDDGSPRKTWSHGR